MKFSSLGLLLVGTAAVQAFKDTSPFLFFSTSELLISSAQIVPAASLTKIVTAQLETCPSDIYVVVSQPGVSAADFSGKHTTPHLKRWMAGEEGNVRSSLTVSDVIGEIDALALATTLEQKCNARNLAVEASTGQFDIVGDMKPRIIKIDFEALPNGNSRASAARVNDLFLYNVLTMLPSSNYTVIYTTTPKSGNHHLPTIENTGYEMDNGASHLAHMDLKRDTSMHGRADNTNDTLPRGPLFERYQFFTPGLFMALIVSFILLSILYVAVSGIAGLQVSYAAFDKELGPAAQRKSQQ